MKLILEKPANEYPYKFEIVYEKELQSSEIKLSANEILKKENIIYNGVPLLENERKYIDFYYNKEGIIEFKVNIINVPIEDYEEYDIFLKNKVIDFKVLTGFGSSGGSFIDMFQTFYDSIVIFASEHPILFSIALDQLKIITQKILKYISEKCNFDIFKRSIYHKKKITTDQFIKVFELNKMNTPKKDLDQIVMAILVNLGYDYDCDNDVWIYKVGK